MSAYPGDLARGVPELGETIAIELERFRVGEGYPGRNRPACVALELVDAGGAAIMYAVPEVLASELALALLARLEHPPFAWRRRMSSRARALAAELAALAARSRPRP